MRIVRVLYSSCTRIGVVFVPSSYCIMFELVWYRDSVRIIFLVVFVLRSLCVRIACALCSYCVRIVFVFFKWSAHDLCIRFVLDSFCICIVLELCPYYIRNVFLLSNKCIRIVFVLYESCFRFAFVMIP